MRTFFLLMLSLSRVILGEFENLFDTDAMLIVRGVHLLTGQAVQRQSYLTLPGPEPIAIQHTFQPGWDAQLGGWTPFPQARLEIVRYSDNTLKLFAADTRGHMQIWEQQQTGLWVPRISQSASLPADPLSARLDPSKERIRWRPQRKQEQVRQQLANGCQRVYKLHQTRQAQALDKSLFADAAPAQVWIYLCAEEQLPSGNRLVFAYDDEGQLQRAVVQDRNREPITDVHVTCQSLQGGELDLEVALADQRRVRFRLHDFWGQVPSLKAAHLMLPVRVEGDEMVPQDWRYRALLRPWLSRLMGRGELYQVSGIERVTWPDERQWNMVMDDEGRVVAVQHPRSSGEGLETVLSFSYGQEDGKCWTRVLGADGGMQRIDFDQRRLPRSITWEDPTGKLLRRLSLRWSIGRPARLLSRNLIDGAGALVEQLSCFYDDQGRLIRQVRKGAVGPALVPFSKPMDGSAERLDQMRSHLSGLMSLPGGLVEGSQIHEWEYDEQGRVVRSSVTDGPTRTYSYLAGTDRKTAEYTWVAERIVGRLFFFHDQAGQIVETIRDDGQTLQHEDCTGVQMRVRTVRQLGKSLPGLGLPIREEEWIGLPGQEQLKRIVSTRYGNGEHAIYRREEDPQTGDQREMTWTFVNGRLVSERDGVGGERIFQYDLNGNCIRQEGPRHGEWQRSIYDRCNRLIEQTSFDGQNHLNEFWCYDAAGRIIQHTFPWGAQERFDYDGLGRKIAHYPPDLRTGGPTASPLMCWSYDAWDQVAEQSAWDGQQWQTTRWKRGLGGRSLLTQHPDGRMEASRIDLAGRALWTRSPDGAEVSRRFDALGNLTEMVCPTGTSTHQWKGDRCIASTDPLGVLTSCDYDPAGRLIRSVTGSRQTTYSYDAWDRCTMEQTGEMRITRRFDALDRMVERAQGPDDRAQVFETWSYAALGDWLQHQVVAPQPSTERRDFDLLHRVRAFQDGSGVMVRSKWHLQQGGLFSWICEQNLPDGRVIESSYDLRNRLVRVSCRHKGAVLWQEQRQLDELGRLVATQFSQGDEPLLLQKRCWNSAGQLIELSEQPSGAATRWRYDADGRLTQIEKPSGVTLHLTYDQGGRIVRRTSSDGSVVEGFAFDPLDRLIEAHGQLGRQQRRWDQNGRLVEEQIGPLAPCRFGYTASGELTDWCSSIGSAHWQYSQGLLVGASLSTAAGYEEVELSAHDRIGRPLRWRYSDPPRQTLLQLDGGLRAQRVRGPLFEQRLESRAQTAQPLQATWLAAGARAPTVQTWSYDEMGHLVKEQGVLDRSFTLNALHARVSADGSPVGLRDHQLPSAIGGLTLEWDLDGRCTRICQQGQVWELTWDALDRLRRARRDGCEILYHYDVLGRLILRETRGATGEDPQWFHYCGQKMAAMQQGTRWWARALCPLGGAETASTLLQHSDEGRHILQHDLQGSLYLSSTALYNAWGESTRPALPWGYRGKWHDPALGMVWMGKRWLHPQLGSFLSLDPLGYPESWSRHAYLQHQPLGHFDLWGCALNIYPLESFKLPQGAQSLRNDCASLAACEGFDDEHVNVINKLQIAEWMQYPSLYVLSHGASSDGHHPLVNVLATGIQTPLDDLKRYSRNLFELSGSHPVYCAWRADTSLRTNLFDIGLDLCFSSTERLKHCRELANHLIERYQNQRPRPIFCVIGHSAGTRSAQVICQQLAAQGWGEQVVALGIGGAACIPGEGLRLCQNVRHVQDPVGTLVNALSSHKIDPLGEGSGWRLDAHLFDSPAYLGAMQAHVQGARAMAGIEPTSNALRGRD